MPGRDGTGPLGRGARTGRGLGPCGVGRGRGLGIGAGIIGLGLGLGYGCRRGFRRFMSNGIADPTLSQEESLRQQKQILENRLADIDRELGNQ